MRSRKAIAPLPDALGALGLRERVLELAGLTEQDLADSVRAGFAELNRQLTVTKVQRIAVGRGQGVAEVEQFVDEDTGARRAAAVELISFAGAYPSKTQSSGGSSGPVQINIRLLQPEAPGQRAGAERPERVVVEVDGKRVDA